VAAGDIACDPGSAWFNNGDGTSFACRQKYTAALLSYIQPNAILGLGDYQYENGSLDAYRLSYDRSWGLYKSITYPAPANEHDQYGGGDYYAYWSSRLPAGTGPYAPYSFDVGTWHLISIPSACDNANVGGCGTGSRVEQWLKADLAAHPNACTLAYWHEPRWTSGPRHLGYTAVTPLIKDLYDAGADVIVNGANHNYERFAPQDPSGNRDDAKGIVEFIAGTGGKFLDEFGSTVASNSLARNGSSFGVLQLVLHPNSYDWSFVPDLAGGYTDSGSRRCR
jgi:hypothetical protein